MTSNNVGRENYLEGSKIYKKGFQMVPLPAYAHIGAIYTIHLNCGLIRPL